jgi:hypothetical protein
MKLCEKFNELFQGFSEFHGEYKPNTNQSGGKVKGVPKTIEGGGTPQLWDIHLSGVRGLGIIPLKDDDTVVFAGIDIDEYDGLSHAVLENKIRELGFPLWVCRSKSGGAHLFLFLKEPAPAKDVIETIRFMAASLGYGGCEIFPKHHTRTADTRVSNWINVPYFNGGESINHCYSPAFIHGEFVTAQQFLETVWDKRILPADLKKFKLKEDEFPDGPPCLNLLAAKGFEDTRYRNNSLFNIAIYYKQAFPESWESKLHVAHANLFNNSGTDAEIKNIIKQVGKKDVKYMCKEPPICDVCNRVACSQKKYGIAALGEKGWVLLDGLTRLVDPAGGDPAYVINANGIPITLNSSADLFNQKGLQRILFDRANVMLPLVKNDAWLERITGLMESIQEIMMPTEASPEGMIFEYLKEYIDANSRNVESLQDIATGRVFIETVQLPNSSQKIKRACFRSTAFTDFLRSRGFRNAESRKIFNMFKTIGGDKAQKMIGGKNISYWTIDLHKLADIVDNAIELSKYQLTANVSKPAIKEETVVQKSEYDIPDVTRKF